MIERDHRDGFGMTEEGEIERTYQSNQKSSAVWCQGSSCLSMFPSLTISKFVKGFSFQNNNLKHLIP